MSTKYQADTVIGNTVIAVKTGVDAVSNLRTALIQLAYDLTEGNPQRRGLLVLVDPKITEERLAAEWQNARRALRTEVMDRLGLVVFKGDQFRGIPNDPDPEIRSQLEKILRDQAGCRRVRIHSGAAFYEIFKIIIHQWLMEKGPMTALWLAKTAGCTYPTVRDALQRLGSTVKRHSDRRIELAYFPREEWAGLVAASNQARSTMRFADRSGQPRSPESRLRRLEKIEQPNLAVGGVFGAKHYYPNLNLVGSPRLDLTIHGNRADLSFVERLDPALRRVQDPNEPANLAIHFVRRHDSLFEPRPEGLLWADPVECLLDLHEMRLESQAREFLNSFPAARGKA